MHSYASSLGKAGRTGLIISTSDIAAQIECWLRVALLQGCVAAEWSDLISHLRFCNTAGTPESPNAKHAAALFCLTPGSGPFSEAAA
jgi:hypothetical protein